jgi:hypothetical protein
MPIDPAALTEIFEALGGASKKPKVTPPLKPPTPPAAPSPPPISQVLGGPPGAGAAQPVKPTLPQYTSPAAKGNIAAGGFADPQMQAGLQKLKTAMGGTGTDTAAHQSGAWWTTPAPVAAPKPTFEQVQTQIAAKPPKQLSFEEKPEAQRRVDAAKQGYTTPAFKGAGKEPQRITDISKTPEGGVFSAANPELAEQYARSWGAGGEQIWPLLLNTQDYMLYNAKGATFSSVNSKVIAQAKKEGAKGVVVHNVYDHPGGATPVAGMPNLGPQTVYITIDPGTMRSKFAKFDPAKKGINDLLASGLAYTVPPAAAAALFGSEKAEAGESGRTPISELFGATNDRTRAGAPPAISDLFSRETPPQAGEGGAVGTLEQIWEDIKGVASEGVETLRGVAGRTRAEDEASGRKPGQLLNPLEQARKSQDGLPEFLEILGGGFNVLASPLKGIARTLITRPLAERLERTDKPASERVAAGENRTATFWDALRQATPHYKTHEARPATDEEIHSIEGLTDMALPIAGIVPYGKLGRLFVKSPTPLKTFTDTVADDLHRLRQTSAADKAEITQRVGAADETVRNQPVQEIVHALIEDKNVSKLPAGQQALLNTPEGLKAVTDAAKHINPLRLELSNLYNRLKNLGIPDTDLVDPEYAHRRAVGHTPVLDPHVAGANAANPIIGYKGQQRTLPTTTTALQERKFMGGQDPAGNRVVVSEGPNGWQVHEPGQKAPVSTTPIDDQHFAYKGQTYTLGQATTQEIEHATPVRYHKNALANVADALVRMRAVARHQQWLDQIRKTPEWQLHATENEKIGRAKGWSKVDIPQLKNTWMEPKLAAAFEDFVRPGVGKSAALDGMRKVNQFATASIFWNPTPHIENVWGHWLVGRGWDWITPHGARSLLYDGAKAIRAVTTQNADYRRLLKAGNGLIYGGVRHADFYRDIARLAGMQIMREPAKWDPIARKLGVGPSDLVRMLYEGSKRTLWWANDVLMMQRVLELERKGMGLPAAIKEAEKHIPNYRIPTEVLGSRAFSQILQEPAFTVFSRYHYGVFNSYANMLRDAFGPMRTPKERFDAIGNMLALGLLTWVVYPALSQALKKVTGEEGAEKLKRGPSARLNDLQELYEGKKSWGQLVAGAITEAPATRVAGAVLGGGRDPFTGQPITEPGSTAGEQVVQATDYAAGQLVAPYQLLGKRPEEEGGRSLGRRVFGQIVGEKDTSDAAERGRRIGSRIDAKRARKRRIHPRGFLERTLSSYGGTDAD